MRPFTPATFSTVVCLLRGRSPTAILWCVWTIVVDAVKADTVALGFWPHISQKVLELAPATTDRYTPATVVGIGVVGRIVASLAHLYPRRILWALLVTSRVAVRCVALNKQFSTAATTTCGVSRSQVNARDYRFCSAVASAQPCNLRMPVGESFSRTYRDNLQTTKPLSIKVEFQYALTVVTGDITDRLSDYLATLTACHLGDWSKRTASALTMHGSFYRTLEPAVKWRGGTARIEPYAP
jgi:hypothetical protein